MKIEKVAFKNYLSLREVPLEELGELVVFIGKNSAGKSNLLGAMELFFDGLGPWTDNKIGPVNEVLWYEHDAMKAIEFALTLVLDEHELREVLPFSMLRKGSAKLEIARSVVFDGSDMLWHTNYVKVEDITVFRDGKEAPLEEAHNLFLLFMQELSQSSAGGVAENAPPPPTAPIPSDAPQRMQQFMQKLGTYLKGKFRLIPAARDRVAPPPQWGIRAPMIEPAIQSALNQEAQGRPSQKKKWISFRQSVDGLIPSNQRLNLTAGELVSEEGDLSIPASLTGGGNQALIRLLFELRGNETVIGLEEPENHMHPELIKEFLGFLKTQAVGKQLFIATHSPFVVDNSDLSCIWVVARGERGTEVRHLKGKDDLRDVFYEMGIKPGDFLLADSFLFVEGEADKRFFTALASKLGIRLWQLGLEIKPLSGIDKSEAYLQALLDLRKASGLRTYVLFDQHGQAKKKKLVGMRLIQASDCFVLSRGDLEDYYPELVLKEALKEKWSVEPKEEDLRSRRSKKLEKLFEEKGLEPGKEKVALAEEIGRRISPEDIDHDLEQILLHIQQDISSRKR